MIHELKTDPGVFDDVAAGRKPFEIRFDDRGYQVGDTLILCKTRHTGEEMRAGAALEYTGERTARTVGYILRGPVYGLAAGWVILGFAESRAASLTMTAKELRAALEFVNPDGPEDEDQQETELTIFFREKDEVSTDKTPLPRGLYCYITEYPEEGCMPLFDMPLTPTVGNEVV